MIEEHDVRTADGRTLATAALGPPDGFPVLWHHGNLGSRVPPVAESVLEAARVRMITYDRPGGGRSSPRPGRWIADAAEDVAAIASAWNVDRFGTVGISGGGSFTLATAALLPECVVAAAVLSGAAPIDAEGLGFIEGMSETNVRAAEDEVADRAAALAEMEPIRQTILANPLGALRGFAEEFPESDRAALGEPEIAHPIAEGMAECVRRSTEGWLDESIAFASPWGFDVRRISCPVSIWHGRADTASPIRHARWLASRIQGAELHELDGGHFAPYKRFPEILAWLRERSLTARTR
ncbi:MAG TPA: alpha/beta hydrolase [Gaiellaceae bacterium]